LRAAHAILRRDLVALVLALADLAESHRDTVMAGRTHAQQALPITFGFKVATWTAECVRQAERLDDAAPRLFVGELGGAVGTLAGFGPRGEAVQRRTLERLGLGVPPIAWHASRDTSVGRAEWVLVPEAACLAAATEHWSLVVVRGLRVNIDRMKENLGRLGGLLLSEAVMLKLGETLGRSAAHDLVYDAAMAAVDGKGSFRELLLASPKIAAALARDEIDGLLDPAA